MPKFIVGVSTTVEVEVEADTQEEAEAFIATDEYLTERFYDLLRSVANTVQLNDAEWNIDYCEQVDEDDDDEDDDDDDEDDDDDDEDDDDLFDIDNFKFANEA